ncbi:MAG: DNA primase [Lachnospiraceae bacterium]|nr:DNA primase [Lachnospiraceae bacterium]
MPWYTEEQIEQVRSANSIVDVIGSYVRLKRTGGGYMGLCPFHNEKSPSFHVNPSRQMYKCFGCGVGGSVITFVMEYENYSFTEAIEALAQRAGIDLPKQDMTEEQKRQDGLRKTLIEINMKAASYYYAKLKSPQGKPGYDYLSSRGLTDDTIKHFGLGYAGQGGGELYRYLRHEGYSDSILKETGLFKMEERGVYDKFWNRVIFPIMDVNNRVIGFGGRVMGDAKPKYLNSPETKLFDKSRNLFGLNYAKLGKKDSFILCEGYMDVIALHQAGFTNAVASLGTAFTGQQANIIRRYTENVFLTYDSDEAGVKAALRAIPLMRQVGINAKIIHMEPYKDPDEFIKALGTEEFQKRIDEAENSFFFEIDVIKRSFDMNDPEQKTKFYHAMAKKLLTFEDKVQRENYIEALAAKYSIRKDDLRSLVIRYGTELPERYEQDFENSDTNVRKKKSFSEEGIEYSYRLLLSWIVERTELFEKVSSIVKADDFFGEPYSEAAKLLYQQLDSGELVPAKIINNFPDAQQQNIVAGMFQTSFKTELDIEEQEKALNELVFKIKEYSIERRTRELKDMNELKKIIEEKKTLQNFSKMHISLQDG